MRKYYDNGKACCCIVRFLGGLASLVLLVACQAAQNNEQTDNVEIAAVDSTALADTTRVDTMQVNAMSEHPEIILSNHTCMAGKDNHWVATSEQYTSLFMQLKGGLLSSSAPQPPAVDFARYGVLFITMGQQRTGGYGITLSDQPLVINNNVATLQTEWMAPSPDMMVIQMLTNPCLLVKVPRGAYSRIKVVDQRDQVKAEFAVQ